jgi:hypothetical protein
MHSEAHGMSSSPIGAERRSNQVDGAGAAHELVVVVHLCKESIELLVGQPCRLPHHLEGEILTALSREQRRDRRLRSHPLRIWRRRRRRQRGWRRVPRRREERMPAAVQ